LTARRPPAGTHNDVDVAYVPYNLITTITISLPHASTRAIGFSTETAGRLAALSG
jgi:hypothetical protein